MSLLRISHLDGTTWEIFAPAVRDPGSDVLATRQLLRIPRFHPRINDHWWFVRDVVAHDALVGGMNIGGRLEPRERRPQEIGDAPRSALRLVAENDQRPAG